RLGAVAGEAEVVDSLPHLAPEALPHQQLDVRLVVYDQDLDRHARASGSPSAGTTRSDAIVADGRSGGRVFPITARLEEKSVPSCFSSSPKAVQPILSLQGPLSKRGTAAEADGVVPCRRRPAREEGADVRGSDDPDALSADGPRAGAAHPVD